MAAVQGTAVEDSRDTRRDKVMYMAGDFESAITAVQHSRTAGLRWSVLADTARSAQGCSDTRDRANDILNWMRLTRYSNALMMQYRSILEWKYKTYKRVWDAQTRRRERMKMTKLEEAIRQWKQRRMKMDEKMKNMKAILRKMIENKKPMKKKADKDKEVVWKTRKSKSKNKGNSRSKR